MTVVFLSYISRSGSTYLANLLNKYPEICVCPEGDFLINTLLAEPGQKFPGSVTLSGLENALLHDHKLKPWGLGGRDCQLTGGNKTHFDTFLAILQTYRDRVKPQASVIVFKGFDLIQKYSSISEPIRMEVNLKLICLVRDGRGAYNSQKKALFALSRRPMQVSPIAAARQWKGFIIDLMGAVRKFRDGQLVLIKYEDLIADKDQSLKAILGDLDLAVGSTIGSSDKSIFIPSNQIHLHPNVGKQPLEVRIEAWRKELSQSEISLFQSCAREELSFMSYSMEEAKISPLKIALLRPCLALYHIYNRGLIAILPKLRKTLGLVNR